jgi:protein phosphatase PTC7
LYYANIGDSGFIVIRSNEKIVFRSKPQQHEFNYPLQLSYISPTLGEIIEQKNDLDKVDTGNFSVQDDDIVILGTDGLFDNLFDSDIVNITKESNGDIGLISKRLLEESTDKMRQEDYFSPFAQSAFDNGIPYRGGKLDDVTIVVGKVNIEQNDSKIYDDDI